MHSRIDANIEAVTNSIDVGNIYINRNQIGAVVGSQPFGGHGLSGTGPKAGGDAYIKAFMTGHDDDRLTAAGSLPGPSGEMNSYSLSPRGRVLVIHPDPVVRQTLALRAEGFGNDVAEHAAIPDMFVGVAAVMTKADGMIDIGQLRERLHLACQGIIPLVLDDGGDVWLCRERHVCRDMTASGGNIDLLMRS
jgi:RHH-type proline utilization regulon transcriptional repressor/proline dehydrogenase/delta 1-pyrroline-5-carboxylate dehydrogenase